MGNEHVLNIDSLGRREALNSFTTKGCRRGSGGNRGVREGKGEEFLKKVITPRARGESADPEGSAERMGKAWTCGRWREKQSTLAGGKIKEGRRAVKRRRSERKAFEDGKKNAQSRASRERSWYMQILRGKGTIKDAEVNRE